MCRDQPNIRGPAEPIGFPARLASSPVRAMAIEIAGGWLRHQSDSELTHWLDQRLGHRGKRLIKISIVALACKLLIALRRYLDTGEIVLQDTATNLRNNEMVRKAYLGEQ